MALTDILLRVMNIVERFRAMDVLSPAVTTVMAVLLFFGALNCVLGYRLLRFWVMLGGFCAGAALGYLLADMMGLEGDYAVLGAVVAGGVLLGIIAFLIYKAGIFILGAVIGVTLGIYVLHPTTSAVFFVCILMGVGIGMLAVRYSREVIIVGTSLMGGVLAGLSLAKLGNLSELPYGVGMSVGFALLGMLIQFAMNRVKEEPEEECAGEAEQPESVPVSAVAGTEDRHTD